MVLGMAFKVCMNILCGTTTSPVWKKGWVMRSGQIAALCDNCGTAYERQSFCNTYHAEDSGWRECKACGKPLHCGCIASEALVEILDFGGVRCISCARNAAYSGRAAVNMDSVASKQCNEYEQDGATKQGSMPRNGDTNVPFGNLRPEAELSTYGLGTVCHSNTAVSPAGLPMRARPDISTVNMPSKDIYGVVHPNLSIGLSGPTANAQSYAGMLFHERDKMNLCAPFQNGPLLPGPQNTNVSSGDTNLSMVPQVRVARPPIEGRGRNQLLPRYWPRITDQELKQLSGDSNCTIIPLFEKVLSASDAGRIGRLVLPKACAEAYFPAILQPEGVPIKIQDVKGREWVFQFRYWPNNNSRMYVLEGVTPCIQSMQLQAGDTVTFSRMDPGGKLVMGCRKASSAVQANADPYANAVSKQVHSSGGHITWNNNDQCGGKTGEGVLISSMLLPDKKKSRNIGSKSKRLLIDSEEMLELKLSWEEAQDMLRPTQDAKPNIVMIEDYEFEEYEEPPVFGKWSIFAVRSSGLLEQWTQCDSCHKWRRLPVDVLLPQKWTCTENIWEQSRSLCSAPDELSTRELENFIRLSKDFKKKKVISSNSKTAQEQESSGLDALASAATLGDNVSDPGTSSVVATTKHPRHRPGCSCIVCIQPPSGKGKHKPSCTCNVCMTVKRRFKTLMLRKKKRQSEQEAEIALRNSLKQAHKDDAETDSTAGHTRSRQDLLDNEVVLATDLHANGYSQHLTSTSVESSNVLNLNCQPNREQHLQPSVLAQLNIEDILQLCSQPLESCVNHNSVQTLTAEHASSSGSRAQHQDAVENVRQNTEDHLATDLENVRQKKENADDEGGVAEQGKTVIQ